MIRLPMQIKEQIAYDPDTGVFRWKTPGRGKRVGGVAGHADPRGYNLIRVNYKLYRGARLAWYLTHGIWPKEVDHINRNKHDDRLLNLREVTHSENGFNTEARTWYREKYVYWNTRQRKWEVKVRTNYMNRHLGVYSSFEEAIRVRDHYLSSRQTTGGNNGESV